MTHANIATTVHTFLQPGGLITSIYTVVTKYEHDNRAEFDKPCVVQAQTKQYITS